ncbi:hypothetical protein N7466_009325 [Penicillium verhagenii]|uniref:uncharacterized protein n=1 Tax=Penicillium verhagenii TaxID=1562060 RepID=UPI00254594C3|nr:uncharacterized protein N7466_009325 [Penicillium verhagenii]KAJ5920999.1 hypothetical protein N7466_009325 [Penicillium verhagenii]
MEDQLRQGGETGQPTQKILRDETSFEFPPDVNRQNFESHHSRNRTSDLPSEPRPRLRDEDVSLASDEESDHPSYVLQSQDGKMRFYGASSGFGAPYSEPDGQNGATDSRTSGETAAQRSAKRWPLTNWIPRVLQDPFEKRTTQALPSKKDTLALVDEFLTTFNQAIPLVDDKPFLRLVERQFSWNPDESPSSWALLNVVLAFSYRERAQTASDNSHSWRVSLGHVKNALNVVVELFLRNADLSAIQALLGLALYFQGTPNAQALFMFSAAAMRLSHSIGLHRNTTTGMKISEIEQRRRIFWIAFILDADISLRVGRPPVQEMEDYNTPLPDNLPPDRRGLICIDGIEVNLLRLLAHLALVQRRLYRHFHMVAAAQQPREMIIKSAMDCEEALFAWRDSIPEGLRPQLIFRSEPNYFLRHLVRMHLAYHSCCSNLRQLPKTPASTDIILAGDNHRADDYTVNICRRSIEAARSALALLPLVRSFGSNYKWNVLYFFATASVALASEVAADPSHNLVTDDLQMIRDTVVFLTNISSEEPSTYVDFILGVCSDLESSARRAVHQYRSDTLQQTASRTDRDSWRTNTDSISHAESAVYTDDPLLQHATDPHIEPMADLLNAQWSFPPFWSWQDTFTGLLPSPGINEGKPDGFI